MKKLISILTLLSCFTGWAANPSWQEATNIVKAIVKSSYINTNLPARVVTNNQPNVSLPNLTTSNQTVVSFILFPSNVWNGIDTGHHIQAVINSRTFTSSDGAFTNAHVGDAFAFYADNNQFTITYINSSTSVRVLEHNAAYTSTTNYAWYPCAAQALDVNGFPGMSIANDGSIIMYGGANSGRYIFSGGTYGTDWLWQINSDGSMSVNDSSGTPYNGSAILLYPVGDHYEAIVEKPTTSAIQVKYGFTNLDNTYLYGALYTAGAATFNSTLSTPKLTPVAVTVGASPFSFSNSSGANLECYFSGTTAYSITKNGAAIYGSLAGDAYYVLQPAATCVITYTVAPTLFTNKW